MADILVRSLAKRLSKIFLGFDRKKDLSLSFFQGESELRDLLFDSKVFNELFFSTGIPMVLCKGYVRRCNIKANLSKLSTEPVLLKFDLVTLELMEIPNDTPGFKDFEAKEDPEAKPRGSKYSMLDKILDGVRVEIEELRVTFQALGHKPRLVMIPPVLEILITNLNLFSVNENWREADLKQCRTFSHPNKNDVYVYKKGVCRVRLALKPLDPSQTEIILADNQQVSIDIIIRRQYGKPRDKTDDEYSSVRAVEISVTAAKEVTIAVAEARLAEILLFVKSMQAFLLRPADVPSDAEQKVLALYLGLIIPRLCLKFLLASAAAAHPKDSPGDVKGLEVVLGDLMAVTLGRGVAYETVEQMSVGSLHVFNLSTKECLVWSGNDPMKHASVSAVDTRRPGEWMERWRKQTKVGSTSRISATESSSAPIEDGEGPVSGWLWKMGWQKSSWKRFYFVCTEERLTWYTDASMLHEDGWVPPSQYSVDRSPQISRVWVFGLIPTKGNFTRRKMYLSAESTQEFDRWTRGLAFKILNRSRARVSTPLPSPLPSGKSSNPAGATPTPAEPKPAGENESYNTSQIPSRRRSSLDSEGRWRRQSLDSENINGIGLDVGENFTSEKIQIGLVRNTIHPLADGDTADTGAFITGKVIDCTPLSQGAKPVEIDILEFELELSILPLSIAVDPDSLVLLRRVSGAVLISSTLAGNTHQTHITLTTPDSPSAKERSRLDTMFQMAAQSQDDGCDSDDSEAGDDGPSMLSRRFKIRANFEKFSLFLKSVRRKECSFANVESVSKFLAEIVGQETGKTSDETSESDNPIKPPCCCSLRSMKESEMTAEELATLGECRCRCCEYIAGHVSVNHMSIASSGKVSQNSGDLAVNTIGLTVVMELMTAQTLVSHYPLAITSIIQHSHRLAQPLFRLEEVKVIGDIDVVSVLHPVVLTTVKGVCGSLHIGLCDLELSRKQFEHLSLHMLSTYAAPLTTPTPSPDPLPSNVTQTAAADGVDAQTQLATILGENKNVKRVYLQISMHGAQCRIVDDSTLQNVFTMFRVKLNRGEVEVELGTNLNCVVSLGSLYVKHTHRDIVQVIHERNEAFRFDLVHPGARRNLFDFAPATVSFKASGLRVHYIATVFLDFWSVFGPFVVRQREIGDAKKIPASDVELEVEIRELFKTIPQKLTIEFIDCLVEFSSHTPSHTTPITTTYFSLASGTVCGVFGGTPTSTVRPTFAISRPISNALQPDTTPRKIPGEITTILEGVEMVAPSTPDEYQSQNLKILPRVSMRFEGLSASVEYGGNAADCSLLPFDTELLLTLDTKGIRSASVSIGPQQTEKKLQIDLNGPQIAGIKYVFYQLSHPHNLNNNITTTWIDDILSWQHSLATPAAAQTSQKPAPISSRETGDPLAIMRYDWWFASVASSSEQIPPAIFDDHASSLGGADDPGLFEIFERENITAESVVELDKKISFIERRIEKLESVRQRERYANLFSSLLEGEGNFGTLQLVRVCLLLRHPEHGVPARAYVLPNGQSLGGEFLSASEIVTWLKIYFSFPSRTHALSLAKRIRALKLLTVVVSSNLQSEEKDALGLPFTDDTSLCQIQVPASLFVEETSRKIEQPSLDRRDISKAATQHATLSSENRENDHRRLSSESSHVQPEDDHIRLWLTGEYH